MSANGRVPNSMVFAGDEGVGKLQFAIELSRSFVCIDSTTAEACGNCVACVRIGNFVFPKTEKGEEYDRVFFGDHSDVGMVVPFKRNVRIGSIRALEIEANFRPYEARARIFVVDDADKMADPAANALLKTLEEPPRTTHIFLITSRPESLLPTIRSRCQVLRFAPVETETIEQYLISERAFTFDEARLAARLSRGSIGRAVKINVEKFRVNRDKMLAVVVGAIETGDRGSLLRLSEEMNDAKNKDSFEENIDILQSLIHDVWAMRIGHDESRLVNSDLEPVLSRLADQACQSDLPRWLGEIDLMRENFTVNINRKAATDALFVKMAA